MRPALDDVAWAWPLRAVWVGGVCGLLISSTLTGCRGVGRSVVGQRPEHPMLGADCERPAPTCVDDPAPREPTDLPNAAAPVDLLACGTTPPGSCEASATPVSGGAAQGGCEQLLPLEAEPAELMALQHASCTALHVVADSSEASMRRVTLEDVELTQVNLRIESEAPLELELHAASLSQVWLQLLGPITLRVSASRRFEGVRVAGSGAEASGAQIRLDDVRGDGLSIGTQRRAFSGGIAVARSSLAHVVVYAPRSSFESSSLRDAQLQGEQLETADTALQRVTIATARSQITAGMASDVHVTNCSALSVLVATVTRFDIDGCEQPARLYGSNLSVGVLDGAAVLDEAQLMQVRLGLHSVGPIEAWDTHLASSRFCAPDAAIAFGGDSSARCVRCESAQDRGELAACVTADGMLDVVMGDDACQALVAPALCEPPEPMRMRPPHG